MSFPIGTVARGEYAHVLGQALKVHLLLGKPLAELNELLLLALADGVVLAGTLSSLESISIVAVVSVQLNWRGGRVAASANSRGQSTPNQQKRKFLLPRTSRLGGSTSIALGHQAGRG